MYSIASDVVLVSAETEHASLRYTRTERSINFGQLETLKADEMSILHMILARGGAGDDSVSAESEVRCSDARCEANKLSTLRRLGVVF